MAKEKVLKTKSKARPMYLAAWSHQPLLSQIWVESKSHTTWRTTGKFQHLIGESMTAEVELIPANLPGIYITDSLHAAFEWLAEQALLESNQLKAQYDQMVRQTIDLSSVCLNIGKYPHNAEIYLRGYAAKCQLRKGETHV